MTATTTIIAIKKTTTRIEGTAELAETVLVLNMNTLTCRADARKMMGGEGPTVSGLYRISGVDWLLAEQEQLSSATTLRFVDLEGLPQDNTFGPLNTQSLTDVRPEARELSPEGQISDRE